MRTVKYWKVDLFSDTGFTLQTSFSKPSGGEVIPKTPFFTGYSIVRPNTGGADDQFIELHVSVDSVEVFRVRRSLIGSVRISPIYCEDLAGVAEPVPSVAEHDS